MPAKMIPTRLLLQKKRSLMGRLLLTITLGVAMATVFGSGSLAHAQVTALATAPAGAPTLETNAKQGDAGGIPEPTPARKQVALTFNPLNLLIGRYGFNFEYQPVPHHGIIVTPHYDHLSGGMGTDGCNTNCSSTLNGGGVELGYRYYFGEQGFDGFFLGPSLIVTQHRLTYEDPPTKSSYVDFTGVGGAFDVGWQRQLGHFIIGGSVGIQYTRTKRLNLGEGEDILISLNADGLVLPRLAFNLGYAF